MIQWFLNLIQKPKYLNVITITGPRYDKLSDKLKDNYKCKVIEQTADDITLVFYSDNEPIYNFAKANKDKVESIMLSWMSVQDDLFGNVYFLNGYLEASFEKPITSKSKTESEKEILDMLNMVSRRLKK